MAFEPLFGENKIFYGADYNPEQWLDYPEILEKDIELMKKAHCNIMSVGIFSWSKLEPQEGVYDFSWLDKVLDRLNEAGVKVFLATPSGARPTWMSHKYPEVLRVWDNQMRAMHGGRHNHCNSSPLYREFTRKIDTELAKRYSNHPAVIGWHISNELQGSCHCPLCKANFRKWMQKKYQTLENLNKAYWSTFWSHTYTSWEEIDPPATMGEMGVHALNLDWKRFNTELSMDFCKHEIDTVKAVNPNLPCTANFMEYFNDYDYFNYAKIIDFVSWDSYPEWHVYKDQERTPIYTAMNHDLMRNYKHGKPWVLMESTPTCTNWRGTSKLKKPQMNTLGALQAVAHGADNVQYFQWRKSRGSSEKFHGAFVDHVGHLDTRAGREEIELGNKLSKLGEVAGSLVNAKVAIVYDQENRWAIDDAQGPCNNGMKYLEVCQDYYKALWKKGVNVDAIDETCDLSKYDVVIAPMTYMIRGDYAKRVEEFVKNGGTYVSSFWSGIVNETDLCFLGGFPGPLSNVLGIWDEEIECLEEDETVKVQSLCDALGFNSCFEGSHLCALIHAKEAQVLAKYDSDFFKGMAATTVNNYGKGKAYYVASRMDDNFIEKLVASILDEKGIKGPIDNLPLAVSCHTRYNDKSEFLFVGNYSDTAVDVMLKETYEDLLNGGNVSSQLHLEPYASYVLKKDL